MNAELIGRLIDSGVLRDSTTGELELTEEFRKALSQTNQKIKRRNSSLDITNDPPSWLQSTLQAEDGELNARYMALAKMVDVRPEQLFVAAISLNWLVLPDAELTGVPESFTPISAGQISSVIRCFPESILYAWRDDCDPCDIVCADFESLIAENAPDDVGLFAIFGPHYAGELREEYEIFGAPTVAFFEKGRVVTRLRGAKKRNILKAEVSRIRQT